MTKPRNKKEIQKFKDKDFQQLIKKWQEQEFNKGYHEPRQEFSDFIKGRKR